MEKKVEHKKTLPLAPLISSSPTALRSPVGVKTYSRKRKVGGSGSLSSDSTTTTSPSASPLPEGRSGRSKWLDILESLAREEDSTKPKQDEAPTKQESSTTSSDSPSSTNKKRKAVQMQLQSCSSSSSPLRSPISKLRSPARLAADSSPGGAKSRKRNKKETASSGARQMYLDLGQERFDWVTCGVCEMTYAPGVPTDEKTHNTFHQRFLKMQSSAASLGRSNPSAI